MLKSSRIAEYLSLTLKVGNRGGKEMGTDLKEENHNL